MKNINENYQNLGSQITNKGFNIKKLQYLIDTGLPSITEPMKQAVLVLGNTGSGKSTLINGLTGKKLVAVCDEDGNDSKIELAEGEKGAKIGDTLVSETTVPKYWLNQETGIGYFDCPGFGDNKGAEQDIANAVFIQQLFTITKEVKVIIVAPEVQFDLKNDRAGPVLKFIDKIADLFPNVDEVNKSICLVVTKAEDKYGQKGKLVKSASAELIKNNLVTIKNDHEKSQESSYFKNKNTGFTKIFDTLLQQGRIEVFKSPIENGEAVYVPESIIKMIDSMPYIQISTINPPISKESYEKISIFYSELQEYVKKQGQTLADSIKKYLNPKDSQGTFKILKLVEEINDTKKFFESKNIGNQEKFNNVSTTYINLIEVLCNIVGFKNFTTLEEELGWMGSEKMKQKINEMSDLEIKSLLNKNPFTFILKSIAFISNVQPPQADISNFSHANIDEIRNMIFDEINKLKSGLIETFNKTIGDIKQTINELLKNNQDEIELEKLCEDLNQAVNINDNKYLVDAYIEGVQKNITVPEGLQNKLDKLNQIHSDISEAYKSDILSFPIYMIKNSLESSFSGIQSRLNQLHKANLKKTIEESKFKIDDLDKKIVESNNEQEKIKLGAEKDKFLLESKLSVETLERIKLTIKSNIFEYKSLLVTEEKDQWGVDCKGQYATLKEYCGWNSTHQCIRGSTVYLNEVLNKTIQKTKVKDAYEFEYVNKKFFIVYATKEINVMNSYNILDNKNSIDIIYKGGNVVFVAPIININAKLNIDLSGIGGKSCSGKAHDGHWDNSQGGGTNGEKGDNGESGKPGGNLIMIAQKYNGLDQNLSINVSGGDGGNGQNAGDGGGFDTYYILRPTYRNGGDGGNGGFAGKGAKPGHVEILQKYDISSNCKNIIKQTQGSDGIPGKGGQGGIPWTSLISNDSGVNGKNGANGSTGNFINEILKDAQIDSCMNHNYVKNDYIKFMNNYAPEAFKHPEDYVDISGHAINYDSFL